MQEKIKISVPETVLTTLKSDCADFSVVKANGGINFNAFINDLIVNYYETFSASDISAYEKLNAALLIIPEKYREKAIDDVFKILSKSHTVSAQKEKTVTFSFKPTKSSEKAVVFIENALIKSESLSSFYRRMFSDYASKPKTEREKIIFKENYDLITESIKKSVKVLIDTKNGSVKSTSVYKIAAAKDELFNYVLSTDGFKLYTIRLANVKTVSLMKDKAEISDEDKNVFNRQIRSGAQYQIFRGENELVKVKMSDKGKFLFKKIYLYRPVPIKTEGNYYYFDCSVNQATHYFKRFGKDGIIVAPKSAADIMRDFYAAAARRCADVLSNENDKLKK